MTMRRKNKIFVAAHVGRVSFWKNLFENLLRACCKKDASSMTKNSPRVSEWLQVLLCALSVLVLFTGIFGQEIPADRLAVPLTDPSRPALVKAGLLNGGITVRGYEGKEVIVEARVRADGDGNENEEDDDDHDRDRKRQSKKQGMRRIPITSSSLSVEEENNVIKIDVGSMNRTIDLTIQVPVKTSLKLSSVNDGDIKVENVQGEIEVNNTNGAVTLTNVWGSVVAHALNDDVVVTLTKVEPDKSMAFTSLNGDIDVTLPPDVRCRVKMKSDNGDLYSDFDIRMEAQTKKVEQDTRQKGGKYKVQLEKAMYGSINGGGPEFQFATFNGDIFIRKGK
jgi:hypothetical protein